MAIPFCAPVGKRDPVLMNPIEKVKENVEIFVNYRDALKTYSDKVLEKSISLGLFEYSEIEKVTYLNGINMYKLYTSRFANCFGKSKCVVHKLWWDSKTFRNAFFEKLPKIIHQK